MTINTRPAEDIFSDRVKPPLVIYHKGCRDGFCAAWVVWRCYPDAEFYAASYNNPAPDVTDLIEKIANKGEPEGRDVIMVDFSYPLADMIRIADVARSLLVLDHHKTAEAALTSPEGKAALDRPNTKIVFDMERSGAGLAWDELFPRQGRRPWLVDYVEDRDLWRFEIFASATVNAFIGTIPYDFQAWDKVSRESIEDAIDRGMAVQAKVDQYVSEVSGLTRIVTFEGYEVPCVNAPHVDISELLNELAKRSLVPGSGGAAPAFSLGWAQHADGRFVYSLRSIGDFDVSEIAKKYGGGGHKNSAGFKSDTLLV